MSAKSFKITELPGASTPGFQGGLTKLMVSHDFPRSMVTKQIAFD